MATSTFAPKPRPRAHDSAGLRRSRNACVFGAFLIALAVGCGRPDGKPPETLEQVVAFGPTIELQENAAVINVTPDVTPDPLGGFLVADEREGQLRRYTREGALLWNIGKKGSGPGEFRSVATVLRLPNGQVLAAELSGSFTLFDSAGTAALEQIRTPFLHVQDMEVVDDSTLLVAARLEGRGGTGPSLHMWDIRENRVRRSFFDPFEAAPNKTAAVMAGWSKAAIRGDTVAAVFALSDTLYFFALDGRPRGKLPIPFRDFRPVPAETPRGGSDPVKRANFFSSFDYVADLHWFSDGRLLIPYQSLAAEQALTRTYHLFAMDRAGRRLFEVRNAPRLLTAEPASSTLFFVAPGSEVPNRWALARLR
ncbi:MAG TPA: hypothetical protein VIB55_00155 [Longimicrobium sp.]